MLVRTIKDLRELLNQLENNWNEAGYSEYFGEFENQRVITDHYSGKNGVGGEYRGLGDMKVCEYWELGLCFLPHVRENDNAKNT